MKYEPIGINYSEFRQKNTNLLSKDSGMFVLGNYDSRIVFSHYTTAKGAEGILKPVIAPKDSADVGCFFVSSIANMNDPKETGLHKFDGGKNVFSLCFSHSRDESLPMWYLYGGITGEGVRISFTPLSMEQLINGIDLVYIVADNKPDMERSLMKGRDFDISCGWVFYRSRDERIRYRDDFYSLTGDKSDAFQLKNYFIKDYAWYYEKEFRIVFQFKDHVVFGDNEKIAVYFDKVKLKNGTRATLAPNITADKNDTTALEAQYAEVFGISRKKVSVSKLDAQYDLIVKNSGSIVENIDKVLKDLKTADVQKIYKAAQNHLKG